MTNFKYNRLNKDDAAVLLAALEEEFEVFVVDAAHDRMSRAGAQLMTWFGVACELHRDWRNDIEGLAALCSNYIPDYRILMTSYNALTAGK